MIKRSITIVVFLFSLIVVIAGFYYGQQIPFAQQWPLFESLRTTSSIIFVVIGGWFAIIYPERLKLVFDDASTKKTEGNDSPAVNFKLLFRPIIHSTAILACVIVIGVIAPIFKQLPPLLPYKEFLRGCSYTLLVMLTIWQLWIVLLTLIPADVIKQKSELEVGKKKAFDSFFSNSNNQK